MGSAFLTTKECPVDAQAKERMIALNPDDPEFRKRVLTPAPFDPKAGMPPQPGDIDWSRAVSFSVVGLNRVLSVRELIEQIVSGAEEILNGWEFLRSR